MNNLFVQKRLSPAFRDKKARLYSPSINTANGDLHGHYLEPHSKRVEYYTRIIVKKKNMSIVGVWALHRTRESNTAWTIQSFYARIIEHNTVTFRSCSWGFLSIKIHITLVKNLSKPWGTKFFQVLIHAIFAFLFLNSQKCSTRKNLKFLAKIS